MRFNNKEKQMQKRIKLEKWHIVFAYDGHRDYITNEIIWFERVWRRGIFISDGMGSSFYKWEYRAMIDASKRLHPWPVKYVRRWGF